MTLEDIQHKLLAYYLPLRRRLSLLIIAGGLVAALMFLYALTKETYFVATATFHPEKTSKSSNFSLDPVALILGGAGGGGGSGHEEMSGVLSSRKLSEIVAADTFFHNGKRQLLADIVLEKYFDLFTWQRAIWLDRETIEDYTYEDKIITTGRMLRGALHVEVDDYGFMMMSLTAADPILVKEVADTYIDELIDYYQEQQTEKAQTDFEFFDKRVKTIRLRLDSVVNFIAGYYDTRKYRTQATAELIVKKKEAEAEYLQQVLQQLLLSREQANSQKQRDRPVIQVLDPPMPPFKKIGPKILLHILAGFALGIFAMGIYLSRKQLKNDLVNIINEALADDPEDA